MLLEEHHRQMPHEAVVAGHRFLRPLGGAQEGMEEFAVFQDLTEQQAGQRMALLVLDAHMHLFDQTRQIDAAGADILAGLAVDAVLHQVFGLFRAMEEIGEDQADGPDIDMPHLMAADQAVDRADIGAGPAAHAAEDLGKERVLGHLEAAVIEDDEMDLLFLVGGRGAFIGPGDPGHIGGDVLAGGVARQDLEDLQGIVQGSAPACRYPSGRHGPGAGW